MSKYTCFLYSEGGRDYKFLTNLFKVDQIKYHCRKWKITHDHASGCDPEVILTQCSKSISGVPYDLIICVIDRDCYVNRFHVKQMERKIKELETKFSGIKIIWQIENAEDEYRKVLDPIKGSKSKLLKQAIKNIDHFIRSDIWKKINKCILEKEKELDNS